MCLASFPRNDTVHQSSHTVTTQRPVRDKVLNSRFDIKRVGLHCYGGLHENLSGYEHISMRSD
ncbi:protein of unknown function [Alcaligenes faecalis subsp. faecalis]|nr:protein of unknown function [Alcaligenes faecalis subsp. faecalis]